MHWQVPALLYLLHAIIIGNASPAANPQVFYCDILSAIGDGREKSLSSTPANGLAVGSRTSFAAVPRKRPPLKKRLNITPSSTTINSTSIGTLLTHSYHLALTGYRAIVCTNLSPQNVIAIMERFYEAIAYILLDINSLHDEHDLVLRWGRFELGFHCVAEYLSVLAVKAVVRRLSQMLQNGLTGFVAGEVVDVTTAVRTMFAFGVALRMGDL